MVELIEASAHVHVANLVVAPALQRRGLGSRLRQLAETAAQRRQRPRRSPAHERREANQPALRRAAWRCACPYRAHRGA
ncbi:GNAT family N-acetyltransferase [Pandoraea sputorum]|uniref:GNAT family N-acetyltransferase n=1 Tax=Pandoraea sputorum TaxID=93222 RepID=UPI0037C828B9